MKVNLAAEYHKTNESIETDEDEDEDEVAVINSQDDNDTDVWPFR